MNNIKIAYDDNLGLPNDFAETIGCSIEPFHDLTKMIAAFDKKNISAMFIPAGTLPYIKNYEIIAQAVLGPENKNTLQSNFVTKRNISIAEIPQMILGRVNQYCTTSFWSPLISLMKFLPQDTSLTFKNTNGFPDMLHKTTEGEVDCSMVWDIIMRQHPQDANKVHELFQKTDLPTPIMVIREKEEFKVKAKISRFTTRDGKAFFSGFRLPAQKNIQKFLLDMQIAKKYFQIRNI